MQKSAETQLLTLMFIVMKKQVVNARSTAKANTKTNNNRLEFTGKAYSVSQFKTKVLGISVDDTLEIRSIEDRNGEPHCFLCLEGQTVAFCPPSFADEVPNELQIVEAYSNDDPDESFYLCCAYRSRGETIATL